MDKLKYVKLENPDGSYSDSIPIAVDSDYVNVGDNTLTSELNNKATKNELNTLSNVLDEKVNMSSLTSNVNSLQTQINSLASGSPAGVYATLAALTSADPNHSKTYIVSADGHWYYYNSGWQDGGSYLQDENAVSTIATNKVIDWALDTETTTMIFELGSSQETYKTTSTNTMRNINLISLKKGSKLIVTNSNWKMFVFCYQYNKNSMSTYVKKTGFFESNTYYELDDNYDIRILLRKTSDEDLSQEEVDAALSYFKIDAPNMLIKSEKNDIIDLISGYTNSLKSNFSWEIGAWSQYGVKTDATNIVRTTEPVFVPKGTVIHRIKNNVDFAIRTYNSTGYIQTFTSYMQTDYFVTEDCYITIQARFLRMPKNVSDYQPQPITTELLNYCINAIEILIFDQNHLLSKNDKEIISLGNKAVTWGIIDEDGTIKNAPTTHGHFVSMIWVNKGDILYTGRQVVKFAFHRYRDTLIRTHIPLSNYSWKYFGDRVVINFDGYINILFGTTSDTALTAESLANLAGSLYIEREKNTEDVKEEIWDSIALENNVINNSSYYFIRIPRYTARGKRILPFVKLTSNDLNVDNISSTKTSALQYSLRYDKALVINTALFNTSTYRPWGQTMIQTTILTNEPFETGTSGTTYPEELGKPIYIDEEGNLHSVPSKRVTCEDLIALGAKDICTGWGPLIEDYEINQDTIDNYTYRAPLQVLGQFANNDYFIFTCDGSRSGYTHDTGLTASEIANFLVGKRVKFAYLFDGGGSTETVLGAHQINPIYEGTTGRALPVVISFEPIAE